MNKKQPRIYISGPISGHDIEERRQAFQAVADNLTAKGFRIFNPMQNGLPPDSATHRHMQRDLNVLTNEDDPFEYIYMMPRWTHSAGCWKEFETAVSCGIVVIFGEASLHDGMPMIDHHPCIHFE